MPESDKKLPFLPSQPPEDMGMVAERVAAQAKADFEAENPDPGGYGTWLAGGGYIQRTQLRGKGALDILLGPLQEPDASEIQRPLYYQTQSNQIIQPLRLDAKGSNTMAYVREEEAHSDGV